MGARHKMTAFRNFSLSHGAVSAALLRHSRAWATFQSGNACRRCNLRLSPWRRFWNSFWPNAPQAVVMEDGDRALRLRDCPVLGVGRGQVRSSLLVGRAKYRAARAGLPKFAGTNLAVAGAAVWAVAARTCWKFARIATARGNDGSRRIASALPEACWSGCCGASIPGFRLDRLSTSPDLEHSLSPVYTRGLLRAGTIAFAVLGVSGDETQASVDAALTFGILWMDHQRQQFAGRAQVEGLKLFLPPGRDQRSCASVRRNLDLDAAKWQIYELDERVRNAVRRSISTTAATSLPA